jgi:hypothetical protein
MHRSRERLAGVVIAGDVGYLQGAWPFGVVEAVWSLVALRRWQLRRAPMSNRRSLTA